MIGLVGIIKAIENYRERKVENEKQEKASFDFNEKGAESGDENNNCEVHTEQKNARLMCNLLEQLGCQPQMQEDGALIVNYQGETFQMNFGGPYIRVWDSYS